jgi:hypothetical protein
MDEQVSIKLDEISSELKTYKDKLNLLRRSL